MHWVPFDFIACGDYAQGERGKINDKPVPFVLSVAIAKSKHRPIILTTTHRFGVDTLLR